MPHGAAGLSPADLSLRPWWRKHGLRQSVKTTDTVLKPSAPDCRVFARRIGAAAQGSVRAAMALALVLLALPLVTGCSAVSLAMGAAGVATDTSIPWAVVKHVHGKLTEGDPLPCISLNSVQRALSERCGAFVPGSLKVEDVLRSRLTTCPLALALRDPQYWPVLPELLAKGAQPEACARSPLVDLAQVNPCPEFQTASEASLRAITWLAQADSRAIHHDVVRMLSCPSARVAGLEHVLLRWQAQGELAPAALAFSPLGALHPDYLVSPFAHALEVQGHTAQEALGAYTGALPPGFEQALRSSHWQALDWWLTRLPELANRVPPVQGNQLPWLPLARVLVPSFLEHPDSQAEMVEFLMARGASPWRKLPFDPSRSVLAHAQEIGSPMAALMNPPPRKPTVVADSASRDKALPRNDP
jgi:hypothetical protein